MSKDAVALISLIVLAAVCAFSGCKSAPLKARCNEQPQWFTADQQGRKVGIYVCFGEENQMLYSMRLMPPAPPIPNPSIARVEPAVKSPKISVKKPAVKSPASLPTLGGTAAEKTK